MLTVDQYLALLEVDLNYTETPAGSNCNKFSRYLGRPCEAWCADFQVAKSRMGGMHLANESAGTVSLADWFKQHSAWYTTGQRGDMVFYDFDSKGIEHIECVESVNPDGSVTSLGGNTSSDTSAPANGGGVFKKTYLRRFVVGFGRPVYATPSTPPPSPVPEGAIMVNSAPVGLADGPGGYWEVCADGGVFAWGVPFYGSMGGQPLNKPIVDMATTPTGLGYWLVASDGGVFAFGDAKFFGSTGSIALAKPITRIVPTKTGLGYRLMASDGGVFCFGDAAYKGNVLYNG